MVYFGSEISVEGLAQVDKVEILEGEEGVSKVTVVLPEAPEGKEEQPGLVVNPRPKRDESPVLLIESTVLFIVETTWSCPVFDQPKG